MQSNKKMKAYVTKRLAKTVLATIMLYSATAIADNSYPTKPITIVVSYPVGGSVDVSTRILQEPLSRSLGRPVIIENRGGAGGTIATRYVARAKPDGYTLLMTLSSHTINPAVYGSLPFDTEADFASVSLVASAPQVLVAHPSFPASNAQELIDYVKQSPHEVPYGSAGTGSPSHIAGELFKQSTENLDLMHIPYRGGGPATVDVVGGQIPLLWVSLPSVASFIQKGDLKAIAVSTQERTPIMPDIPAMSETVDGFNVDSWYAMFAPAGTPEAVITKLHNAIKEAVQDQQVIDSLAAQGAVAVGGTPQELDAVIQTEIPAWKKLAKSANIRID